jgi:sensor c-di-GMP phosphodiesterase-like protein
MYASRVVSPAKSCWPTSPSSSRLKEYFSIRSSLSYLHQLPVDELKIDKSFISRLGGGNSDGNLVEAIISMARALNLSVVAEGAETTEQLEILPALGCDLAQGYLFALPQPAEHFLARLTANLAASRLPART